MLTFAGTYPEDGEYWSDPAQAEHYPLRFGDVFATPPDAPHVQDSKGKPWHALMAVHPSCELGSKPAPRGVQVVRVHKLKAVSAPQRQEIRVGLKEVEGGLRVVHANTVYLAPLPGTDEELFADLRDTARVPRTDLEAAGRLAAMSHDARVAVIRRELYFRYRWAVPLDDVVALEAARICGDPDYQGPKPGWVPG